MALALWVIFKGEEASDGAAERQAAPAPVRVDGVYGVYVVTSRRRAHQGVLLAEAALRRQRASKRLRAMMRPQKTSSVQ